MITEIFDDNLLEIRHENLVVHAVIGQTQNPLIIWPQLCKSQKFLFGPTVNEVNRGYMEFLTFSPFLHLTATQDRFATSIIGYSLNGHFSKNIMQRISEDVKLGRLPFEREAVELIEHETVIYAVRDYELAKLSAHSFDTSVENVFGAHHYSTFLQTFESVNPETSLMRAYQRFGIFINSTTN